MYFLKLLSRQLIKYILPFFQACLKFYYHHLYGNQSSTTALINPGKGDLSAPDAWQSIALLNTLEKVLEVVVASKVTALSKEHCLLPSLHINAFSERLTDTALYMLVKQFSYCMAN